MTVETATARVRAEFDEMPGMTLTVPQASRLFGLEPKLCMAVVDHLVKSEHLRWTRAGLIARGDSSRAA
jgi:hypothetical protein